jgi:predicted nucleic acid-binding Zn ribbon protein
MVHGMHVLSSSSKHCYFADDSTGSDFCSEERQRDRERERERNMFHFCGQCALSAFMYVEFTGLTMLSASLRFQTGRP